VRLCINQVTLGECDFQEAVAACSQAGFCAIELWLPHVEGYLAAGHSIADARTVLGDHGTVAVGACFVSGLLGSEGDAKREAFDVAKARFELCCELGVGTIACVGDGPWDGEPDTYAHVAERAREIGDLAASFGLMVGIEFIAGFPFLGTLATAARLIAEADHPHVGVLLDAYHFHAGRSTMADFDTLNSTGIAFVHVNDAADKPRDALRDGDRVLPGAGAMPLSELIARTAASGYDGYYSLELFNEQLWALGPAEAARQAYQACQTLEP